ncbi:MAG: methyltransferase domain-containing protein [Desulfuromonadaceae bacterium]|nr:methyltransferase domain-containing protein [Desulfuromonadaceae bacterium]
MIQDPKDQHIKAIVTHFELTGKDVLEIGCGKGRITRDLAKYARSVVAIDPDMTALAHARATISAENVEFKSAPEGIPKLPEKSFDLVIYTLSLHHVPEQEMLQSLKSAGRLLREEGRILVLEPGDGGSFNELKRRFGAGSGDEAPEKAAAIRAMQNLEGWSMGETIHFEAEFLFNDAEDFFINKLPDYRQFSAEKLAEITEFLNRHTTDNGIILSTERRLNGLIRKRTGTV